MKKALSNYFKKVATIYTLIVIVVLVIISFFIFRDSGSSVEVDISQIGTITERINVTGKVAPLRKADLGFEKGGVVSKINYIVGDKVKMGDVVINLDSNDVLAQLQGSQANLLAEKARLTELVNGLRPEELSVEGAKLRSAQVSYEDARTGVANALHDSYVKTENAILNYSDSFFTNPQTVVPKINIRTENRAQEMAANDGRLVVGENLRSWKTSLDSMTTLTDPIEYLDKVHGYLDKTKAFMSFVSTIVSNLTPGNSGLSQELIDSYNVIISSALSTFNTAVGSLASAEASFRSVSSTLTLTKDQYGLKKAGSSEQAIQAQQAKVDQAIANVLSYQAEVAKKKLVSPIDGIVTKVQPELGEFVSAGQSAVVIMSDFFKVEVNIPESDIAKVLVGNPASVTLDAYGDSVIFNSHVTAVDPAETIVEGVPTYKVTLQFDQKDERVRSGMTANIDIITNNKENVVTVPYRAIISKNGGKYVRVISGSNGNDYEEVRVEIGIRGNDGKVEIVNGLNSGVKIVTSIK